MADIFGRTPEDYTIVRDLQAAGLWERHQAGHAARRPWITNPRHDFNAFGSGVPKVLERASEDQQAAGFLTNNMLAIQTMIDEIMYTAYRLPEFLHINTNIPEGARSYGVRVTNRRGRASRISAPGFEAPSATVSEAIVPQELHWYGLDAEWSIDELRGAMMGGLPLDTQSIDAAVTGTLESMEEMGLTGGDYSDTGLLNHPTTDTAATAAGTRKVNHNDQPASSTFAELNATQVRDLINKDVSNVIEGSKETLGRNVATGMTVYLPGPQYDLLTSKYVGDHAERTIMRTILEDNPWTHFTNGNPLMFARVLELKGRGSGSSDRMITALKHERVAEIGVSIQPRVLRILDKGRVMCAQVEGKFSPTFVKRPDTIWYRDKI